MFIRLISAHLAWNKSVRVPQGGNNTSERILGGVAEAMQSHQVKRKLDM